jgi:hypothetical protein
MEDLLRYLDDIVEPTITDFESHPTSVRHAFLACAATFHAIDYLAYPRKSRGLRQKFRKESADFAIVDDVAHAFKHVVAGDRRKPSLKAQQVISRPPARLGVLVLGLSRLGDAHGGVTLANDVRVDLLGALKRAVTYLRELPAQK